MLIAGADAAYPSTADVVVAAAVLWDSVGEHVVEQHVALAACLQPYRRGNFAAREARALIAVLRALTRRPAVILCDGHGRAHPRRWGLACEVAAGMRLPTVGCAKAVLCGQYTALPPERGATAEIVDNGETIGCAVRTQTKVRPVFVSVGGFIELDEAVRVVLSAAPRFRIPEPLRLAHQRAQSAANMVLAHRPARE